MCCRQGDAGLAGVGKASPIICPWNTPYFSLSLATRPVLWARSQPSLLLLLPPHVPSVVGLRHRVPVRVEDVSSLCSRLVHLSPNSQKSHMVLLLGFSLAVFSSDLCKLFCLKRNPDHMSRASDFWWLPVGWLTVKSKCISMAPARPGVSPAYCSCFLLASPLMFISQATPAKLLIPSWRSACTSMYLCALTWARLCCHWLPLPNVPFPQLRLVTRWCLSSSNQFRHLPSGSLSWLSLPPASWVTNASLCSHNTWDTY